MSGLKPEHEPLIAAMNVLMRHASTVAKVGSASSLARGTPETLAALKTITAELKRRPDWRNQVFARFVQAYADQNRPALAKANDEVLAFLTLSASPNQPEAA